MQLIYCVEDEAGIRDLVVYALKANGYLAEGFDAAEPFYNAMKRQQPDIVLLDIMLPGNEDGMSILKRLKSSETTAQIPVIMLTAKSDEYDKVIALNQGADDYVQKPFGVMELIARIGAVLRRSVERKPQLEVYQAGGLSLCPATHAVTVAGEKISLSNKEFQLLEYLLKNRGIVQTRDRLMSAVWGFDYEGETRTVDVHIRFLRQKLGVCGELIETVRGVGYRICAEEGE